MIWLAYVGIMVIGMGGILLAISALQYQEIEQQLEQIPENVQDCIGKASSGLDAYYCSKGGEYARTYLAESTGTAKNNAITGILRGVIGVSIFAVGYKQSIYSHLFEQRKTL